MTTAGSLHGAIARTRALPGLTLAETVYHAGQHLPTHAHESAYFCLVLEGAFTESSRHESRVCGAHTLIVHREDDEHANRFHSRVRCFNVVLNTRWRHLPADTIMPRRVVLDGGHAPRLARRMYHEFRDMDDLSALIIEGLTLEVLGETARASGRRADVPLPRWMREARDLLHDRFRDSISLSDVAAIVRVHPTHLAREFRHHHRCTVGEYLRELRVAFACRQLAASTRSISDIAAEAGFFDHSHFAKAFRQSIGVSPSAYRRLARSR